MQNNITDEQLLDEEITIVPSTLSPGTFSTQVSQRLGIRSLSKRIADAARPNDTNDDNNGASSSTTGVASLSDEAQQSIEVHLNTPLKPILKGKARANSKYQFLRHCMARDLIPKGMTPKVPLKIENPPQALKDQWDETLRDCGAKLLRILMSHHRDQISSFEEMAHDQINQASHLIIPEFVSNFPNIGNEIEEAIENLIAETSRSIKKLKPPTKRSEPPNETTTTIKRPRIDHPSRKNVKGGGEGSSKKGKGKSLKLQKKPKTD